MSKEPLEKLASIVVEHFSAIPDKRIAPTIFGRDVSSIEQTEVRERADLGPGLSLTLFPPRMLYGGRR